MQLFLELGDLFLVLTQKGIFWVLIDSGLVLDVFGSAGIPQSVDSFIVIVLRGAHIGNHHSLGVSTKRILEHSGELRVTVRDVGGVRVDEGRYNVAQGRQRQVDLGSFLQAITSSSRLRQSLRTGQIHHVKFTHSDVLLPISANLTTLHSDLEEGMRSARLLVHGRGANRAVFGSYVHDLADLVGRLGRKERQRLHIHTRVGVLLQLQPVLRVFGQKIADFLVVDF